MRLSTKARYAVRALVDLGAHENGTPLQIKDIAARENLSVRYLENLFTLLRSANILKSSKGKNGGFLLARNPEDITIREIIEVVEGDLAVVSCVIMPDSCDKALNCTTRKVWNKMSKALINTLNSITLAELIADYKKIKSF